MQNAHRYGIAALIALTIVAGSYAVMKSPDTPPSEAASNTPPGTLSLEQLQRLGIRTAKAELADYVPLGMVPAVVSLPPEARVAVTAPVPGAVVRLFVIEGQEVRQGQPLAIIRSQDVIRFGAEQARARARLGLAEANAARTGQLVHEGIVAGTHGEEARAALQQARTDVAEANRMLAIAGADRDGNLVLRAPIDGKVSSVGVQTGGPVDGLSAPFVIDNNSRYNLDLQLPERIAQEVRPGMKVTLDLSGDGSGPAMISGEIISVGSAIDPMTRSIPAKARIDAHPRLVPGKGVIATIEGAGHNNTPSGVTIPSAAITRIGGDDVVFVSTGTRFDKRVVTVAGRAGDKAMLSAGLKPDEAIAVSGISELKVMLAGE